MRPCKTCGLLLENAKRSAGGKNLGYYCTPCYRLRIRQRVKSWRDRNLERARNREYDYWLRTKDRFRTLRREWSRQNYYKHRDKRLARIHMRYAEARTSILKHYGGDNSACACCGESRIEFLSIDHINGGGNKHLRQLKGESLVIWIAKNNFPEGFQILCHNCNHGKRILGQCPHNKNKEVVISVS